MIFARFSSSFPVKSYAKSTAEKQGENLWLAVPRDYVGFGSVELVIANLEEFWVVASSFVLVTGDFGRFLVVCCFSSFRFYC